MTQPFVDPQLVVAQPAGQAPLAAVPAASGTVLGQLAADFRDHAKKLIMDVPGRDGYEVQFDTVIPFELWQAWQVSSADATAGGGINAIEFAVRALAAQCQQILKDGQPLVADGMPVTFDHTGLQEMLGALDTAGAVRRFYGQDGIVLKASGLLMREAGYGVGSDPTKR